MPSDQPMGMTEYFTLLSLLRLVLIVAWCVLGGLVVTIVLVGLSIYLKTKERREVREVLDFVMRLLQTTEGYARLTSKQGQEVHQAVTKIEQVVSTRTTSEEDTNQMDRAEAVATVTDRTSVNAKLDEIHILVNSGHLTALKVAKLALRRLAAVTKDPADEAAADEAEETYLEQKARQERMNNKLGGKRT